MPMLHCTVITVGPSPPPHTHTAAHTHSLTQASLPPRPQNPTAGLRSLGFSTTGCTRPAPLATPGARFSHLGAESHPPAHSSLSPPIQAPASPELLERNSRLSSFSFKLHAAQILKTLKSGRVERIISENWHRGGLPYSLEFPGMKNIWHETKKNNALKLDLVLISRPLDVNIHRTL